MYTTIHASTAKISKHTDVLTWETLLQCHRHLEPLVLRQSPTCQLSGTLMQRPSHWERCWSANWVQWIFNKHKDKQCIGNRALDVVIYIRRPNQWPLNKKSSWYREGAYLLIFVHSKHIGFLNFVFSPFLFAIFFRIRRAWWRLLNI